MISSRTILFFLFAVACFSILKYRTWEQDRPCREWKQKHAAATPASDFVRQADGSFSASFNPCNFNYSMAWLDRALGFVGFAATVAFVISLTQDVIRWRKRRLLQRVSVE
jgi:hypothetical protein